MRFTVRRMRHGLQVRTSVLYPDHSMWEGRGRAHFSDAEWAVLRQTIVAGAALTGLRYAIEEPRPGQLEGASR